MILDQKNDQQQQVDIYLVVRREKCHRRFVLDRLKHSREDDVLDGVGDKIIEIIYGTTFNYNTFLNYSDSPK